MKYKFRGKRIDGSKSWVYGSLLEDKNGNCYIITPENFVNGYNNTIGNTSVQPVSPETVGMFTGLKVIGGKHLYDGDVFILGDKNIKYVVELQRGVFVGRQIGNKSFVGLLSWIDDIEIVGSIHDEVKDG